MSSQDVATATNPIQYSYHWPVPPPPGFQGWSLEPDVHNRWILRDAGGGAPLVYLIRKCRNEDVSYKLHLGPQFVRLRNMKATSLHRFATVVSPELSAENIAGWWAELLLTNKVPSHGLK